MASDSIGSSVGGQTGRPSMWDGSGERKLARLYTYTRLSMEQIQKVLGATVFRERPAPPGEDSIHKKLSTNLDKEMRWLRPKTDTDLSRRFAGLATSPTRSHPPDNALRREHSSSVSSHNTIDDLVKDEPTVTPNFNNYYTPNPHAAMYWAQPIAPAPAALPAVTTHNQAFAAARQPEGTASFGLGIDPMSAQGHLMRQSTILSTTTDMTSVTIKQALPNCDEGLIRKVSKLMKRYTIPTPPIGPNTPENWQSVSPGGVEHPWTYDEDEDLLSSNDRPLPGAFLRMDLEMPSDRQCKGEEWPNHRTRCFCDAAAAAAAAVPVTTSPGHVSGHHWVSEAGVSYHIQHTLNHIDGLFSAIDQRLRDPYGNTMLHLLAARDVHHETLIAAMDRSKDLTATNSAGQTCLHLLGPSWFAQPESLIKLLHDLDRKGHDIFVRDVYGKTIFHVLEDKFEDNARPILEGILQPFQHELYHHRDAFGVHPGRDQKSWRPALQLDTSFLGPGEIGSRPIVGDGNYSEQARLLQFIEAAHVDCRQEDDRGRNGLHCLAAVILSEDTLRAQYPHDDSPPVPDSPSNTRKRKFHTPHMDKKRSDSTKGRLSFRWELLQSLLRAGADPNHYAADGTTPLMAFIMYLPEDGDYKIPPTILSDLITAGARVDARNRKGETALHVAARFGRKLATRILVQNGANVHARDSAGRSVLDVLDIKYARTRPDSKANAVTEACRAYLTGSESKAIQNPSITQEWGWRGQ
ncbi:hypothetical protein F5X68DRAFT_20994 [Plectosphaerella plurivora]|uniref:Ankyrin repeat protein n=1 Tax=Plectosphaerella plurivora TaxID=936078 RepID=A0A9P8V8U2_9PEZI|nr:hypothetical protein F5X68DRAFT_20994 [Plectosphaerella plurivora]